MKEITVESKLPVIKINFEEVKASLQETISKYEGLVVTEEGLKDCKMMQKELASLRNKIDSHRKGLKKEMEQPIKAFEGQCKELIQLIVEAENPIKEGISVFDDKRRLEKVKQAEEYLVAKINKMDLADRYKAKISISDITINLSNTMKSIKEDIDQRIALLQHEQEEEIKRRIELKETIEVTLDSVNKTIKTPLQYSDFERYINMNWTISEVVREINQRAEIIRRAEQPKEEVKQEVKEETGPEVAIETKISISDDVKKETLYFVEMKVVGTLEEVNRLSQFLKSNDYKYEAIKKGVLK